MGKSNNVTFSILAPCYLRAKELEGMLRRTLQQTHHSFEIVVVDDNSPGDDVRRVAEQFEHVLYVRTPENRGIIGARNYGILHCRGEFIVNLDDDSWFVEDDALDRLECVFRLSEEIGIVAFNLASRSLGYPWKDTEPQFDSHLFSGGANAYRASALERVGPYIEEFYRQGEEMEHSIRFMDEGYRVVAAPSIHVFHDASPINRNNRRANTYEVLNSLRRELALAPVFVLPLTAAAAAISIVFRRDEIDWNLLRSEAFGGRASLIKVLTKMRRPVRLWTYVRWIKLRLESRRRIEAFRRKI